jgi:hypothetical protein
MWDQLSSRVRENRDLAPDVERPVVVHKCWGARTLTEPVMV